MLGRNFSTSSSPFRQTGASNRSKDQFAEFQERLDTGRPVNRHTMKKSESGKERIPAKGKLDSKTDTDRHQDDGLDGIFGNGKADHKKEDPKPAAAEKPDDADKGGKSPPEETSTASKDIVPDDDDAFFSGDDNDDKLFISSGAENDPWFLEGESAPIGSRGASKKRGSKKTGCWNLFTTLFFIASLLIAIALFFAWKQRAWIAGKSPGYIETSLKNELAAAGIYFTCDEWTYLSSRGLIGKNMIVFQSAQHRLPLLKFSDIAVNSDWIRFFLRRQNPKSGPGKFSGSVNWKNSTLTLFDSDGKEAATFENLDGNLAISPDQLSTRRIRANSDGLLIDLSGNLKLPKEENKTPTAPMLDDEPLFAKVIEFLDKAGSWTELQLDSGKKPSGSPPVLQIQIEMDAARPAEAAISGLLQGQGFHWRGIPIRSALVPWRFDASKKILTSSEFQIGYEKGNLGGTVDYDIGKKVINLHEAHSDADLIGLASRLKPSVKNKWKALTWINYPYLQVSGSIPLADPTKAELSIDCQQEKGLTCEIKGRKIPVRSPRGNFQIAGGRVDTRNFACEVLGGTLRFNGGVDFLDESHPLKGLIEIEKLSLHELSPFLGEGDVDYNGDLFLTFRGSGLNKLSQWSGNGELRIDHTRISQLPMIGPVQKLLGTLIPAFATPDDRDVSATFLIESGILISSDLTSRGSSSQIQINGSVSLDTWEANFQAAVAPIAPLAIALNLEGKDLQFQGRGHVLHPDVAVQSFPQEYVGDMARKALQIPSEGAVARIINEISTVVKEEEGEKEKEKKASEKKDDKRAKPVPSKTEAESKSESDSESDSVDEAIMSIFRKSANDLKAILESVDTPQDETKPD